jgi:hypothetical protein
MPKDQWPELVGKPVDEAVAAIKKDSPGLNVISVPQGGMVTMDYRLDRVRVFHKDGAVSGAPRLG